jgi:hypothetical protein
LLVRWINSLDIWTTAITVENLHIEIRTGVLLCNILKFHQPGLDFSGLNLAVRAKKPCINNLEKAVSVMMQKGIPTRYVLTAEEIFESVKPERIWLMIRSIFEVFAMHDVQVLKPKILAWVSSIITYYSPFRVKQGQKLPTQMSTREFYQYY